MSKEVYYGEYLQLDKILNAQAPESFATEKPAHDEMLFITIHQVYEIWFKQILFEAQSVIDILSKPAIVDNSSDLPAMVHRLKRCNTIMQLAVDQVSLMETMTPLDFLDFRNLLRPASGFQSMQFKILEAKLGLRMEDRHGKEYYVSQLKEEDRKKILELDNCKTMRDGIIQWLERLPFFIQNHFWKTYQPIFPMDKDDQPFWNDYYYLYQSTLTQGEEKNMELFETYFYNDTREPQLLSKKAMRAALFIMLYRDFPLLQMPFQLITELLDLDELLSTWRFRHFNMVRRTIGRRVGTGGSTGQYYLKGALDRHYIFGDFADMTSFLIERGKLPVLSAEFKHMLGFEYD